MPCGGAGACAVGSHYIYVDFCLCRVAGLVPVALTLRAVELYASSCSFGRFYILCLCLGAESLFTLKSSYKALEESNKREVRIGRMQLLSGHWTMRATQASLLSLILAPAQLAKVFANGSLNVT